MQRKAEEKNPARKEAWQERNAGGFLKPWLGRGRISRKKVPKGLLGQRRDEGCGFVRTRNSGCKVPQARECLESYRHHQEVRDA